MLAPPSEIKIALVDDHSLFRSGLRLLLAEVAGFEVVMEAENGREFLEQLPQCKPDVVLLDINMPELDGIQTTQLLKKQNNDVKIIILSLYNDERFVIHLMEMGVNAYLLKTADPAEVEKAIRQVMKEEHYFTDFISRILLRKASSRSRNKLTSFNFKTDLSDRELEILSFICQGLSNQEIAARLFISCRTVEGHRKNIMEKLQVKNTASMVAHAIRNHLV